MPDATQAQSVTLTIDGQLATLVEKMTVRAKRSMETLTGYGVRQPQAVWASPTVYEIELCRVRLPTGQDFDQWDWWALDNFTVSMQRDGRQISYRGCRWVEIEETVAVGKWLVQRAVLTANVREVTAL